MAGAMSLLSNTDFDLTSIFIPLAILLALVGLMMAILSVVRRKIGVGDPAPRDFSLGQLRELHSQGKLTDEEFEKAKSLMVSKVHSNLAKEVKPSMVAEPLNTDLKSSDPRR